jgi:uncharacterized membrane protein YqjE
VNTLRLYIAALAILHALAYPIATLLGSRWPLLISVASIALAVRAMWTSSADLTQPHPTQRTDSYRVAAQRSEEATVRVVRPKRRVLNCEYTEAKDDRFGWSLALCIVSIFAVFTGTLLYVGVQWALMPTILLAVGAVVCLGGFTWCNRTVRAWRDQERGER